MGVAVTDQPVVAAFNPNEARDPTGKWTAGGGSAAQNQQLEADRKARAPSAAPKAHTVALKARPKGGGGGSGGKGGGKAAAKKAAAAKKTQVRKGAAAKAAALRKQVTAQEAAWRAAETNRHGQFLDAYRAAGLAEQQRQLAAAQRIDRLPTKQRQGARRAESAKHLAWLRARQGDYLAESKRHNAAEAKIKADTAALNAERDRLLAEIKADEDKQIAAIDGTKAPAKAKPGPARPAKTPVKASAALSADEMRDRMGLAPVTADAVAHTRTPRQLEDYWVHGIGAAKIRWGEGNDWYRCVAQLSKYVHNPHVVKGQCNSLHKIATGLWPATHDKLLHGGKAA